MTERPSPARPHFWLRPGFWRWLARLLVAGILLLLAGAVWVLVHPPALDPFRDDLEGWLSRRLDRPVAFEHLTWTWDGGLTVRAMEVRVGERGLAADEVRLSVATLDLLRGRLEPRDLELIGPRLRLERGPEGRLSVAGFRLDPGRNRTFAALARLERLRIRDGRLLWVDRSRGRSVTLALEDWGLTLERRAGRRRLELTGAAAGGRVAVNGTVDGFERGPGGWQLDVQVRGTGLAGQGLRGYVPGAPPDSLPGPLSLWAEVQGGLHRATRIQGHFRLTEGELRWPRFLRQPLAGMGAAGDFRYRGAPGRHRLMLEDARLAAGGVTVTGRGGVRWGSAAAEPRVEARLRMAETPVGEADDLLAVKVLPPALADWLRRALVAGTVEEARAEVSGPLARFPFFEGGGTFRLEGRMAGLDLAYHPEWPALTNLSGTLELDRRQLTMRGDRGRVLRARVKHIEASVHDVAARPPRLRLRGDLDLQLADGVRFLERSPLQSEGFLEPALLVGPAELSLGLDLPLAKGAEPEVFGRVRLQGAAFRPRPGTPALVAITGEVGFQNGRIRGQGLRGRLLGRPVTLDLDRRPDGPFRGEVAGRIPAQAIRTALRRHGWDHPLNRRLTGELGVRLGVVWGREERHAELHADLERAAVILPEPAFNGIGEPGKADLSWRLEPTPQLEGSLTTSGSQWRILVGRPGDSWEVGLAAGLGREAPAPEPGLCRVLGQVDRLPLGRWAAFARLLGPAHLTEAGRGLTLPRLQAAVQADRVSWQDWDLGSTRVLLNGRLENDAYVVTTDLHGERAAGRVEWKRQPARRDDLQILLEKLILPAPKAWRGLAGLDSLRTGGEVPALDLVVQAERIELGKRRLRGTRLQAQLFPDKWLLHGLQTRQGTTELRLQGGWRRELGRTQLRLDLDTRDFGAWLRSVGVYPSMKGGQGSLGGTLWWPGRPTELAPGRLSGDLRLRMVEGEIEELYFLSKGLATLNVLDWPRQVARGFRDVARSGLVFREIRATVNIANGIARTEDWVLESAPLRLTGGGRIDLQARSYDLLLRIQPLQTVDRIISAVPVLGYLLTGDGKTVMALDYRVEGPWSDPQVRPLTDAEEENPVETFFRRLKEMEWEDVLPWR